MYVIKVKLYMTDVLDHNSEHNYVYFRVNGPLSHSEDFVKAFNCPVGSNMNAANKCQLW